MWRRRWTGVPRPVRVVVGAGVLVLSYGGIVHVVHLLAGRLDPYPWAPAWLAAFFISLTVLDPLTAGLLLARRRVGLYLACAVLVADAAANGYAVYVLPGGGFVNRLGQAAVTLLALAALLAAPRVSPWLLPRRGRPVRSATGHRSLVD